MPNKLDATSLKLWQRLCACKAAMETQERQKSDYIDKFAYCLEAHSRHAEEFKDIIPIGLTKDILLQKNMSSPELLEAKGIWETVWDSTNSQIVNTVLPAWFKISPNVSGPTLDYAALLKSINCP
jgi:hypothetical protein